MPIGEEWTGSARCAHCWKGQKGGPPKRKQRFRRRVRAPAPRSPAGSSGRADGLSPSLRFGRCGECAPTFAPEPCRRARLCECRRVRRPARPPRGSKRRAERGRFAGWRRTQSQPQRLSRGSSCAQATGVVGLYPHVQPYWFIYEPSCAKPRLAQKLKPAPTRRERRNGGGAHWTQPIAKSREACFAPSDLTRGPGIPTISTPGRPRR